VLAMRARHTARPCRGHQRSPRTTTPTSGGAGTCRPGPSMVSRLVVDRIDGWPAVGSSAVGSSAVSRCFQGSFLTVPWTVDVRASLGTEITGQVVRPVIRFVAEGRSRSEMRLRKREPSTTNAASDPCRSIMSSMVESSTMCTRPPPVGSARRRHRLTVVRHVEHRIQHLGGQMR
jgi:hypothetical protein